MTKEAKILKWRLSEKPTVTSLKELVDSKIITTEEARQILLDETQFNSKDFDDVLEEIKLLRKLVLEVAERQHNPETIIKIIERYNPIYIERWKQNPWIQPYINWCGTTADQQNFTLSGTMTNAVNALHSLSMTSGTDGTIYTASS